jgi:hypothetical protein
VLVVHQDNQPDLPFQTIFPLHQSLIFPDREYYQVDRKQVQILLPLIFEIFKTTFPVIFTQP